MPGAYGRGLDIYGPRTEIYFGSIQGRRGIFTEGKEGNEEDIYGPRGFLLGSENPGAPRVKGIERSWGTDFTESAAGLNHFVRGWGSRSGASNVIPLREVNG